MYSRSSSRYRIYVSAMSAHNHAHIWRASSHDTTLEQYIHQHHLRRESRPTRISTSIKCNCGEPSVFSEKYNIHVCASANCKFVSLSDGVDIMRLSKLFVVSGCIIKLISIFGCMLKLVVVFGYMLKLVVVSVDCKLFPFVAVYCHS